MGAEAAKCVCSSRQEAEARAHTHIPWLHLFERHREVEQSLKRAGTLPLGQTSPTTAPRKRKKADRFVLIGCICSIRKILPASIYCTTLGYFAWHRRADFSAQPVQCSLTHGPLIVVRLLVWVDREQNRPMADCVANKPQATPFFGWWNGTMARLTCKAPTWKFCGRRAREKLRSVRRIRSSLRRAKVWPTRTAGESAAAGSATVGSATASTATAKAGVLLAVALIFSLALCHPWFYNK